MNKANNNKNWFTLIELIIAVTIVSIIMLSILFIYTNIVEANKKLQLQRVLQENTKNTIESIASEIRNNWINYDFYNTTTETLDYSWNWNKILSIKWVWEYCMMKTSTFCDSSCYTDPRWCFLWRLNTDIRLNDDNVEISNLRFFISWKNSSEITNLDKQWKATIIFDIRVAPQKWLKQVLIDSTKMHIETTISEMYYKK